MVFAPSAMGAEITQNGGLFEARGNLTASPQNLTTWSLKTPRLPYLPPRMAFWRPSRETLILWPLVSAPTLAAFVGGLRRLGVLRRPPFGGLLGALLSPCAATVSLEGRQDRQIIMRADVWLAKGSAGSLLIWAMFPTLEGWRRWRHGVGQDAHRWRSTGARVMSTEFQFRYNNRENPDIFGTAISGC